MSSGLRARLARWLKSKAVEFKEMALSSCEGEERVDDAGVWGNCGEGKEVDAWGT